MTTPRAESIRKAREQEFLPITLPRANTLSQNKIDHYAGLAHVMRETFLRYVGNTEQVSLLQACASPTQLRHTFVNALIIQSHDVLHSEEFSRLHAGLQDSQSERLAYSPTIWRKIEENLEAGAHTFINTTEAIYDILEDEMPPGVSDAPQNFVLLDRLAKLNISQFIPYRDVYLETRSNRHRFMAQLERIGKGVRFRHGYPGEATIPNILVGDHPIAAASDYDLHNVPVTRVKDIPEDRVTLGCPITFYAEQIPDLWGLYADARASMRRRRTLGNRAMDSSQSW